MNMCEAKNKKLEKIGRIARGDRCDCFRLRFHLSFVFFIIVATNVDGEGEGGG